MPGSRRRKGARRRRRAAGARSVEAALGVLFAAGAAWGVLVGALGPDRIGAQGAPVGLVVVGVALAVLGIAIVVTAQRQMGPSWRIGIDEAPTGLVARGLFAHVRNPIYLGVILVVLGVTAMTPCVWTLAYSALITALLDVQARLEERHMVRAHGGAVLWAAAHTSARRSFGAVIAWSGCSRAVFING
jgi:protein-S-isoprenylcysteine O-methyltransferase Ste14